MMAQGPVTVSILCILLYCNGHMSVIMGGTNRNVKGVGIYTRYVLQEESTGHKSEGKVTRLLSVPEKNGLVHKVDSVLIFDFVGPGWSPLWMSVPPPAPPPPAAAAVVSSSSSGGGYCCAENKHTPAIQLFASPAASTSSPPFLSSPFEPLAFYSFVPLPHHPSHPTKQKWLL